MKVGENNNVLVEFIELSSVAGLGSRYINFHDYKRDRAPLIPTMEMTSQTVDGGNYVGLHLCFLSQTFCEKLLSQLRHL
jgi:hypothetical protein